MPVGLFSLKDAQEIKRLVLGKRRRFIRRERVREPRGTGRRGGGACTNVLRIYINTIVNSAEITGDFCIRYKYDGTDYDVTYAHNATNAAVKSAFETAMTAESVTVTVTGTRLTGVTEVTFPDMSLLVLDRESTHTLEDAAMDQSMIHLKVLVCCS